MHRFGHHHWMHGFEHHGPPPGGYGVGGPPEILLSTLNTLVWIALFAGLAWLLLRWIIPYIIPLIVGIFSTAPANPPALEILRQRYAAGEIDAVTFEQMRERLEASYQQEGNSIFDNSYLRETGSWSSIVPKGKQILGSIPPCWDPAAVSSRGVPLRSSAGRRGLAQGSSDKLKEETQP